MIYDSLQDRADYFPPLLGNGDIAFSPDCEGALAYTNESFEKITVQEGCIFRAGRRLYISPDFRPAELLSFGSFIFDKGQKPNHFIQNFLPEKGRIESVCSYADGTEIHSSCLIHPSLPLYALEKTLHGSTQVVSFAYILKGYNEKTSNAIEKIDIEKTQNGADIHFIMHGMKMYKGTVSVFTDLPCTVSTTENSVTLKTTVNDGEKLHYYVAVSDDFEQNDCEKEVKEIKAAVDKLGFDGLKNETEEDWQSYFAEGFVQTEDDILNAIYINCLYGIRCFATKWSIPVGLNNLMWDGKFFAFDEYYSFLGLLTANRLSLAKRVPDFRAGLALKKSVEWTARLGFEEQARIPWQTDEQGEEVSVIGIWRDHVFHISLAALGAFQYYTYSMDKAFLSHSYRLIRACAKFFTLHMLYEKEDGSFFVGHCTDLERLGPSVLNPFFTACGAVKTLEVLVKAADILKTDKAFRDECENKARLLRKNLPEENNLYVPFKGCDQKSIAVFAGKFPFDVVKTDEKLLNTWEDFISKESEYGNMYNVGKSVSPWYACWKAAGYARAKMPKEATEALKQAYNSVGAFCEMFEINEQKLRQRPWFTTAEGIFLSSVNEMLLQSDGENIYILPAYEDNGQKISFSLSTKGGAVVKAEIDKGKLLHYEIIVKESEKQKKLKVYFKGKEI